MQGSIKLSRLICTKETDIWSVRFQSVNNISVRERSRHYHKQINWIEKYCRTSRCAYFELCFSATRKKCALARLIIEAILTAVVQEIVVWIDEVWSEFKINFICPNQHEKGYFIQTKCEIDVLKCPPSLYTYRTKPFLTSQDNRQITANKNG